MGSCMVKYAGLLQFKGTNYAGFQRQKNGTAIQNVLESTLSQINNRATVVRYSGRTDAGVHAWGMPFVFWGREDLSADKWMFILNRMLPKDMRVISVVRTSPEFDPQLSAVAKQYLYCATQERLGPLWDDFFAYLPSLSIETSAVISGARKLVGEHDFKGFSKKGSSVKSTRRKLYEVSVMFTHSRMYFSFVGNGFLYGMVRLMVGTLLQIGWGKQDVNFIDEVLSGNAMANYSAPAQGLHLVKVWLEPDPFLESVKANERDFS